MQFDSAHYQRLVKLASWASLGVAGLLIVGKLYAWIMTGSASIMASLTDSVLDIAASAISFFIVRYALQPADDEHRFGHGKAESLAGLGQAAFICGSALLLVFHGLGRISHPAAIQHYSIGLWVSALSIVLTLILVLFQQWVVSQTQSVAIKADSLHYKGDLLLNAAVLLAVWLSAKGVSHADGIFTILIAAFLVRNAWSIARESADSLMDKELSAQQHQQILTLVLSHPEVLGVHEMRTRQAGHTKFIQMHLEMDDDLTLYQAHQIADEVELSLVAALGSVDVIIHEDPHSLTPKPLSTG